jgi:hypothetical protein
VGSRQERAVLVACATLLSVATASAQELEPRAYSNVPVGLNFAVASYAYSEGDVATDASAPIEDAEIELHSAFLAYARAFGLLGRSGKIDVVVPYAWLSGSALVAGMPRSRRVDGFADPRLRVSYSFFGAPALTLEEFADYEQDLVVGASLQVIAPLGHYDSDKLVNLGTNRWTFKPELGISKAWWGRLTTEFAGSVALYTDNDDFFGGKRREQDPLYSLQAHLIYSLHPGIWVSLDGTWYAGGETTVDGQTLDDHQENTRLGATFSFPVSRYVSLKVYAATGVETRTGGEFDVVGAALQVRWGAGL